MTRYERMIMVSSRKQADIIVHNLKRLGLEYPLISTVVDCERFRSEVIGYG